MASLPTRLLPINPLEPEPQTIEEAAAVLRKGGLVAFPTETVYGLGAMATDRQALRRVFAAKGRPADNPLILHVADPQDLRALARELPAAALTLAGALWPGPLTLVVPRAEGVPDEVTGGLETVAIRLPDHPVARALIRAAGAAVAAPSANTSGRPSPTTARDVWDDLQGRVELILDGGPTGVGVESTVVDVTGPLPVVLRPGGVSVEELEGLVGRVIIDPAVEGEPLQGPARSPGMKYRHYAPQAPAVLLEGAPEAVARRVVELAREAAERGERVGAVVMAEEGRLVEGRLPAGSVIWILASREEPRQAARRLYQALREMDRLGVDRVLLSAPDARGLGLAVRDRMRRAAGHRVERL